MALTTYSGVTIPQEVERATGTGAASTTCAMTIPTSWQIMVPGDVVLVFVEYNSSTASVSSITNTGTGLTWTRLAGPVTQGTNRFEVWSGTANTTVQLNFAVTIHFSAAVTSLAEFSHISGAGGFDAVVTASGSSTTATATGPVAANANNKYFMALLLTAANTSITKTHSTPSSFEELRSSTLQETILTADVVGIPNSAPSLQLTLGTSAVWFTAGVSVYGIQNQLDDYTFLCRDGGVLLGNPSNTLPIYDVEQVAGLDDSIVNSSSDAIDGAHGSYVVAKFLQGKTVVIDGTMYANPPVDESLVDALKASWRPASNQLDAPFYYKLPNKPMRWGYSKPLQFTSEMTPQRALGVIPFQGQLALSDPRTYSLPVFRIQNSNGGSGTIYTDAVTVGGNIDTYPVVYFNVYAAEVTTTGVFNFSNRLWLSTYGAPFILTISIGGTTGLIAGSYMLDMGNRSLTRVDDNSNWTGAVSGNAVNGWPGLVPGLTQALILAKISSSPTDEGFAYSYADAWR